MKKDCSIANMITRWMLIFFNNRFIMIMVVDNWVEGLNMVMTVDIGVDSTAKPTC